MAENQKDEQHNCPLELPKEYETFIENGKNVTKIRCQRCSSLILSPSSATLTQKEIFLPHMKKKSEDQKPEDGEKLQFHWIVHDMYTFDNVGFTKNVGTTKFLICADCEVGPIGLHDTTDKTSFYVAVDRVSHS